MLKGKMQAKKENGTTVFYITDVNGEVTRLTSAEIIAMKNQGKKAGLRDFLNGAETIVTPKSPKAKAVVEELDKKGRMEPVKPTTEWASISLKEVREAGYVKDEPKLPWYKKLFKGGEQSC